MMSLRRKSLHEHIVSEIGKRIVSGEFPAGEPLPSESVLYAELGISRTALREALRVLGAKGLVDARPKRGTVVRGVENWNFLDAEILNWRLDSADQYARVVDELYELRHLIEPVAASLAAERATAADIKRMREEYQLLVNAGDDGERFHDPDVRFHRAIICASGNALFSSLASVMSTALSVNFDIVRNAPAGHKHSMPDHKRVLDAIVAHDGPAARLAMQRLIDNSQRQARLIRRQRSRAPRLAKANVLRAHSR